jgi:hypothetical protein
VATLALHARESELASVDELIAKLGITSRAQLSAALGGD